MYQISSEESSLQLVLVGLKCLVILLFCALNGVRIVPECRYFADKFRVMRAYALERT